MVFSSVFAREEKKNEKTPGDDKKDSSYIP